MGREWRLTIDLTEVVGEDEAEGTLEGDMGGEKADGRRAFCETSGGDDMIVKVCVTEPDMAVGLRDCKQ